MSSDFRLVAPLGLLNLAAVGAAFYVGLNYFDEFSTGAWAYIGAVCAFLFGINFLVIYLYSNRQVLRRERAEEVWEANKAQRGILERPPRPETWQDEAI